MPPSERRLPERSEYNENFSDLFNSRFRRRFRRFLARRGRNFSRWYPDADFENEKVENSITGVDLMKSKNGKDHHTDEYETLNCVVRRGQLFTLKASISRKLESDEVIHMRFQCIIDGQPLGGPAGTTIQLNTTTDTIDEDQKQWQYRISEQKDSYVIIEVFAPSNAIVCPWKVTAVLRKKDGDQIDSHTCKEKLYMLFNPWNKDDDVYVSNDKEREEYVLNEDGRIYTGSAFWPYPKPWEFGQFESPVLEVSMGLLDKAQLTGSNRRSPVFVSRAISALVNSQDDDGVLIGNWSGDYSGGISPSSWTGSVEILENYVNNGEKPVAYGQCWVFSGIVTSIMRALGVPCRSVTNFDSAHDTDENLTRDIIYDENMERTDDHNDSVWNFHVWNEVWMKRPELPPGYNGWQIIDGTPQEVSDGIYQLGPCPQASILDGSVYLPYDAKFVFAEVNADVVHWQWKDNQWNILKILKNEVGTAVLTKAVGYNSKHDITNLYKKKDGSDEERLAVMSAVRHGNNPYMYRNLENFHNDVYVTVHTTDSLSLLADNFTYKLYIRNDSKEKRAIKSKIVARKTQYTGVGTRVIDKQIYNEIVEPGEEKQIEHMVKLEDVLMGANDDSSVKLQMTAHVKETGQLSTGYLVLPIEMPQIQMTTSSTDVMKGETVYVDLKVANPFNVPLTKARFEVSGAGLSKPQALPIDTVKPNDVAGTSTSIVPVRVGPKRELHATFSCKQFEGSRGLLTLNVRQPLNATRDYGP